MKKDSYLSRKDEKGRYLNLEPENMHDSFTDPFGERRGQGPASPKGVEVGRYRFVENGYDFSYTWFGHSSLMIKTDGIRILSDPCFSDYASPLSFAGPRRYIGRNVRVEDLPKIDIVLITHNHYDHLDSAVIRKLRNSVNIFICPMGVKRILMRFGVDELKIRELDWWDKYECLGLKITCCPGQHFSSRNIIDSNRTLWCSYFVRCEKNSFFISGDGGYGTHFRLIKEFCGSPDVAFMECGQYNIRWHGHHMFPEESVQAALDLEAGLAVPVHWGAYNLSDHFYLDPPDRFEKRAEELSLKYMIPDWNKETDLKDIREK